MQLPITNPVLSFALILLIILFVPMIFRLLKLPGLVGLLVAGTVVGPSGLNLLERGSNITMFGTVGLLYIMFQAGLELDMTEFTRNRHRSVVFGLLSFAIAQLVGTLAGIYLLSFSLLTALLFAAMMASYTLLAYPIASQLGIHRNEAVTVAVGGIIVTDTMALLVLAVVSGLSGGEINWLFGLQLIATLTVLILFSFLVVPRIAGWFFRKLESEGVSQYLFVLAVVFILGYAAEVAKVEPIIGAFFGGLALNRLIPENSALMNRIHFVGNAIFIPFFLLSVGMLIDFNSLFRSTMYLPIAFVMVSFTFIAKFAAAWFTKKMYRYTWNETMLVFGLSIAHAAATLAIVMVGIQLRLFDESVLNATMVLIMATCLASSFLVEVYGRRLALHESHQPVIDNNKAERILIPISNPASIERLVDLSIMLSDTRSKEPLYPLAVISDSLQSTESIAKARKMLEKATLQAAAYDRETRIITRLHYNIPEGILNAAKELLITSIVIGWNGKITTLDRLFGSVLDQLVKKCHITLIVAKLESALNLYKEMRIVLPEHAEHEPGFTKFLHSITNLARQIGTRNVFLSAPATLNAIEEIVGGGRKKANIELIPFDIHHLEELKRDNRSDSLLVIMGARKGSVSYTPYMLDIPYVLSRHFRSASFLIVFPEMFAQSTTKMETRDEIGELIQSLEIQDRFRRLKAFGRKLLGRSRKG